MRHDHVLSIAEAASPREQELEIEEQEARTREVGARDPHGDAPAERPDALRIERRFERGVLGIVHGRSSSAVAPMSTRTGS